MRLDLLGINILSIGEHDDFLASPGNEKIAAGIEIAQIAGIEPSVAKHVDCGFRAIPISLHHDRAVDCNLARRLRALFHRFRVHNLGFDARERPSDGTKHNVPRRVDESAAGGFRQAVRVQNVDAK